MDNLELEKEESQATEMFERCSQPRCAELDKDALKITEKFAIGLALVITATFVVFIAVVTYGMAKHFNIF